MSERAFECLQRLSIATYVNTVKNDPYDFDSYFELTYRDSLRYILEFVKYKDIENFTNSIELIKKNAQNLKDMNK